MPAPKGNSFATKDDGEAIRFPVTVRGLEAERKAWRKAAAGQKFNDWARGALNAASSNDAVRASWKPKVEPAKPDKELLERLATPQFRKSGRL